MLRNVTSTFKFVRQTIGSYHWNRAQIIGRDKEKRSTTSNSLTTHYTADSQSPSTPYTEPQFPPPNLKASRHGETGQSKEKSISFRSSRLALR